MAIPSRTETSKCCNEDAEFIDNLNSWGCSCCEKPCDVVDWLDPDSLTDAELKMAKQRDREDREMWEDLEKAQFSN